MSLIIVGDNKISYSVRRGSVGSRRGWCFESSNGLFISALYRSAVEAEDQMVRYVETGKFDWYGSAE